MNKNALPMMRTSWSMFHRRKIFFAEMNNPFSTTKNKTTGIKPLNLCLIITLFSIRCVLYQFIEHHKQNNQGKQPYQYWDRKRQPFIGLISCEHGEAKSHKNLCTQSCIAH